MKAWWQVKCPSLAYLDLLKLFSVREIEEWLGNDRKIFIYRLRKDKDFELSGQNKSLEAALKYVIHSDSPVANLRLISAKNSDRRRPGV